MDSDYSSSVPYYNLPEPTMDQNPAQYTKVVLVTYNRVSDPLIVQMPAPNIRVSGKRSISKLWLFIVLFVVSPLLGALALFYVFYKDPSPVTAQIKFGANETFSSLSLVSELEGLRGEYTLSSDRRYLAYITSRIYRYQSEVVVWDILANTQVAFLTNREFFHPDNVITLTFLSENKTILMCTTRGLLKIWEWSTMKEVLKMTFPYNLYSFQVTKDFKKAVLRTEETIQIWNFDTQKVDLEIKVPNSVLPPNRSWGNNCLSI
jgi:hypothetical protein